MQHRLTEWEYIKMSKSLYLECGSGISGDMTVAALLDLGADREVLEKSLESLKLPGYEIAITRVKKSGLDACDFNVILDAEHENHDHDMAYLHGDGAEVHDHPHDHEHHHDHDEHDHDHCCSHDHDHDDHDHDEHDHDHCCGHHHHHHHADEVFTSWGTETPRKYTDDEIRTALDALINEHRYGVVLRAKGIVPATDGGWIHFDYVPGESDVRRGSAQVTGRVCVIGSHLAEDALKELFHIG